MIAVVYTHLPQYNFFRVGAVITGAYEWQSIMIGPGCMCGFNVVWLHEHSKNHGRPTCRAKSPTAQDMLQHDNGQPSMHLSTCFQWPDPVTPALPRTQHG